jgi:hypothetical protein
VTTKKVKKKVTTIRHPITKFTVSYSAASVIQAPTEEQFHDGVVANRAVLEHDGARVGAAHS